MNTHPEVFDHPAIRQLFYLWTEQSADEQYAQCCKMKNKRGFSGIDARILTSIVDYIREYHKISEKQLTIVFKKLPKYHKQLANMPEDFQAWHYILPLKVKKLPTPPPTYMFIDE